MGKIIVAQFVTLDGVVEDPDGSGGTPHGGWAFRYGPEAVAGDKFRLGPVLDTGVKVLGRTTWQLFARLFPSRTDDFSRKLTAMDKLVVSRSLDRVDAWANSTLLRGELVAEVERRRAVQDVLVTGSGSIVDTLVAHDWSTSTGSWCSRPCSARAASSSTSRAHRSTSGWSRQRTQAAACSARPTTTLGRSRRALRAADQRTARRLRGPRPRPAGRDRRGVPRAARGRAGAQRGLGPAETATTVRAVNGELVFTDGPFAETKEVFGGFYLVEADDLDAALALAARIPAVRMGGSGRGPARHPLLGRAVLADVFRAEWGRLFAALVGFCGDVDVAEDAAQDAFAIAARRWPIDGTPDKPLAWLVATGRNRAIDRLRRDRTLADKLRQLPLPEATPMIATTMPDERLELVFLCCHPALSP